MNQQHCGWRSNIAAITADSPIAIDIDRSSVAFDRPLAQSGALLCQVTTVDYVASVTGSKVSKMEGKGAKVRALRKRPSEERRRGGMRKK